MYTPEQLVDRWEAQRDLKNLMGKYALTMLLEERDVAFDRFWSSRRDVCYGVNEGWYCGPEAIQGLYRAQADRTRKESELICKLFPEKVRNFSPEQKETLGHLDDRPVSSPVICVADDMMTAQGMWTSAGCYNEFSADYGPQSHWCWQIFAVDFVWEDDKWRIWHMQQLTEIDALCGSDWSGKSEAPPVHPEFSPLKDCTIPAPNVPGPIHQYWSPGRRSAELPTLPRPYATFDDAMSYGLKGVE